MERGRVYSDSEATSCPPSLINAVYIITSVTWGLVLYPLICGITVDSCRSFSLIAEEGNYFGFTITLSIIAWWASCLMLYLLHWLSLIISWVTQASLLRLLKKHYENDILTETMEFTHFMGCSPESLYVSSPHYCLVKFVKNSHLIACISLTEMSNTEDISLGNEHRNKSWTAMV